MAFGRRRKPDAAPETPDHASDAEKDVEEKVVDVDVDAFARLDPTEAEKLRAQVYVPPPRKAGFKGASLGRQRR